MRSVAIIFALLIGSLGSAMTPSVPAAVAHGQFKSRAIFTPIRKMAPSWTSLKNAYGKKSVPSEKQFIFSPTKTQSYRLYALQFLDLDTIKADLDSTLTDMRKAVVKEVGLADGRQDCTRALAMLIIIGFYLVDNDEKYLDYEDAVVAQIRRAYIETSFKIGAGLVKSQAYEAGMELSCAALLMKGSIDNDEDKENADAKEAVKQVGKEILLQILGQNPNSLRLSEKGVTGR
jgi:hypothetical protein